MARGSNLCKISDVPSLLHFKLCIHLLPVVCHGKDGISTLKGRPDLVFRVDVGCNALNTSGCQSLCIGLGGITCDAPNLELAGGFRVAQDGIDNRTTLVASSTKYDEDFLVGHIEERFAGPCNRGGNPSAFVFRCSIAGEEWVAAPSAFGPFSEPLCDRSPRKA